MYYYNIIGHYFLLRRSTHYYDHTYQCFLPTITVILPTITKPTRVTQTSATLIDHFYTNDITGNGSSGIIINDVADHFGTFYISKSNISHENPHL